MITRKFEKAMWVQLEIIDELGKAAGLYVPQGCRKYEGTPFGCAKSKKAIFITDSVLVADIQKQTKFVGRKQVIINTLEIGDFIFRNVWSIVEEQSLLNITLYGVVVEEDTINCYLTKGEESIVLIILNDLVANNEDSNQFFQSKGIKVICYLNHENRK